MNAEEMFDALGYSCFREYDRIVYIQNNLHTFTFFIKELQYLHFNAYASGPQPARVNRREHLAVTQQMKELEEWRKKIKYVIYNRKRDSLGYYAGKYQHQHEIYGIWGDIEKAKIYNSLKAAQKVVDDLYNNNSIPADLIIKEIDENRKIKLEES
jgi:hypothetical protein